MRSAQQRGVPVCPHFSLRSYITAAAGIVTLVIALVNVSSPHESPKIFTPVASAGLPQKVVLASDAYNLARLPWKGRSFVVAALGCIGQDDKNKTHAPTEPAPALRELLGRALGRVDIAFRLAFSDEPADIVLLCNRAAISSIKQRKGGSLVLAFDASEAAGDEWMLHESIDGAFRASRSDRPAPTLRPGPGPRAVLSLPRSRYELLLNGPVDALRCGDGAPAAPSGRTRRGRGVAWCEAVRSQLLAAYVRSLHRGDAAPTGRAVFMTYGSAPRYDFYVERLLKQAQDSRVFADTRGFTQFDVGREFQAAATGVYDEDGSRGDGFWSWKPHLIRRLLEDDGAVSPGDVLMYSDAMNKIRRAPIPYLELAGRNGTCTFQMPDLPTSAWTKGAAFSALGADPDLYGPLPQCTATALVLRKDPFGVFVATQWEWYAMDADAVTDKVVGDIPNAADFRDHRHDQALWSLLVYQLGAQVVLPTDETWPPGDAVAEFVDRKSRFDPDPSPGPSSSTNLSQPQPEARAAQPASR